MGRPAEDIRRSFHVHIDIDTREDGADGMP